MRKQFLVFILLLTMGCGNNSNSPRTDIPVVVRLKIPEYKNKEEFWRGIHNHVFLWRAKNKTEPIIFEKDDPILQDLDFSVGGTLVFQGRLADGFIMIQGEVNIPSWEQKNEERKIIEIYLQRLDDLNSLP